MTRVKVIIAIGVIAGSLVLTPASAGAGAAARDVPASGGNPPSSVDNSKYRYLRPVFSHLGHACGFAAGVGYAFTYEINALRDLDAKSANNQYSYVYPYHFFNDGCDSVWIDDFTLAFDLIKRNGIPNCADQGGFETGFPTRWVNGYEKYYRGMQNRIADYFSIDCRAQDGLNTMRQWLYDHSNGSPQGGVLNFSVWCLGVQEAMVPIGSPEAGATILTKFGYDHPHSMTIVGYNDSVRYDMNNDKKYTNNIDINGDGKIDMQDWEVGAFKLVNSWGASSYDNGFAWAPYSLLALPAKDGGITRDNKVFGMHAIKSYSPKLTIRATITHAVRNAIKITAGVSENPDATAPEKIKTFGGLFNSAGGAYPMEGKGMSATLEFGLDISELYDSIGGEKGTFFLIVESKAGTGTVDSFALVDYTVNPVALLPSVQKALAITSNTTLNLGIVRDKAPVILRSVIARSASAFFASPNPVSPSGKVRFTLPALASNEAFLSIVTVSGRAVFQACYDRRDFPRIAWDLKSAARAPLAKGVYLASLSLRTGNGGTREFSATIVVR